MQNTQAEPHQVMALFSGSALSFNLSKGATLADLADRLDCLSERHIGLPTAIFMKFAPLPLAPNV
jgi:hypothetical protein